MGDRYDPPRARRGRAAGCVLAGRLSEDPDRSVCLVEAGPDYGHLSEGRWRADILDPRRLALESHLNLTAVALAERASEWL